MEIGDYIRVIRQRGWIIILAAVLTAAAAFGFSKMQTPVYESSLRMLVQPARTDFGQSQAAKLLLRGYVQWIRSSYRAASVIDELQLDLEPADLLADAEVASDDSSFVIQIRICREQNSSFSACGFAHFTATGFGHGGSKSGCG